MIGVYLICICMCKIFSDDVDKLLMKKNHMRYVMSLVRHLEKIRSYLHASSDMKISTMSLIDMTQSKITKERIVFFHLCHIQFFSSLNQISQFSCSFLEKSIHYYSFRNEDIKYHLNLCSDTLA